ncbi:MAG: hypothetical protein IJN50_05505 [Clostridia bacterium]|nr:hypothetical protein [Clostridia bacterium]
MVIWYVQENLYTCDIVKRWIIKIKKLFNIIDIKKVDDKTLCYLPFLPDKKIKRINKISKKLNKILYKNDVQNIVLSEELYKQEELKNILYSNNINILNGRKLFNYLAYDTLEYILEKQGKALKETEVSILVNDNNELNLKNISLIANEAKRINIITNNVNRFKVIEKNLLNEAGIMIRITNNCKQALANSRIILNMDFPEELLNKYNIFRKAIIINLNNEIKLLPKKFQGINIKGIKCHIPEQYKMDMFENEVVYESLIINLKDFSNIRNQIVKDSVSVESLIGYNGKISNEEFSKIHLTKNV